jgi:hypothetical protein
MRIHWREMSAHRPGLIERADRRERFFEVIATGVAPQVLNGHERLVSGYYFAEWIAILVVEQGD